MDDEQNDDDRDDNDDCGHDSEAYFRASLVRLVCCFARFAAESLLRCLPFLLFLLVLSEEGMLVAEKFVTAAAAKTSGVLPSAAHVGQLIAIFERARTQINVIDYVPSWWLTTLDDTFLWDVILLQRLFSRLETD